MQVSNNIHYSSDAYLISKKEYDAEHKSDSTAEEHQADISATKLEEKLDAKTVNALQPLQVVTAKDKNIQTETAQESGNSSKANKNAVAEYSNIQNNQSPQEQFNSVKEMV